MSGMDGIWLFQREKNIILQSIRNSTEWTARA